MDGLIFSHGQAPLLGDVPAYAAPLFRNALLDAIGDGWRLVALFGVPAACPGKAVIFAVLAGRDRLCALCSEALEEFDSISAEHPSAQLFEREIFESLGVNPRNHPWLKAVRATPDSAGGDDSPYGFYRVQGGQTHEVGVGPIHAGIIEPGHFRFQCYGEIVLNLEIALGYQHRGIEDALLRMPSRVLPGEPRLRLVECLAGDSSIAHATAQCAVWESMLGDLIPRPGEAAWRMRRVGLELERLACHCGDLGALAGDTGFLPTSSWNGRIRGDFLNLTAAICGNRFGREYLRVGGNAVGLEPEECARIAAGLEAAGRDALGSCQLMFESASVLDRMNGIGALGREQARELGLVGVPARASGLELDARFHFPLYELPDYGTRPRLGRGGDVYSRAHVRYQEMHDSLSLVRHDLEWLAAHPARADAPLPPGLGLPPGRLAVALVEGWRGEICHVAISGAGGRFAACKFFDPSFHNWIGLSQAMRDGQISDFPLCNKSFNLSYCGHDL